MGFCVHVTESTPRQVREVNLERLVGDVEELERGIALYLMVLPCRECDRPGVIAWSNRPRVSIQSFCASYFFVVLLKNSEHR